MCRVAVAIAIGWVHSGNMKQPVNAVALVILLAVYALVMIGFVAPNAIGVDEGQHVALLIVATAAFLAAWWHLTARRILAPGFAFAGGLFAGVLIGVVEFALASTTWPDANGAGPALNIAGIEFGGTFVVLVLCLLSRRSGGPGSFYTRKYHVGPWLALGGGMWLGAAAWLLIFIAWMMEYGVRGLSG
jgi:hypothetical protein